MSDGVLAPVPISIVFDGGSLNNPGHGYGSYQIAIGDEPPRIVRLDFGSPVTNNEAEYLALIHGLEDAVATLTKQGIAPEAATVDVRGDSQLVLRQVGGEWKVRQPHLRPLHERATALVGQLGSVALQWHQRRNSVRILGH
ncbi:MAG: ribonuclease [Chloroflexota bacterium]|jgi:ribonuclease HI|nr:ribonuclease [Chloroflexota bacterium]